MSGSKIGIMIARDASDPHKPGYVAGYQCAICAKALEVSPSGVRRAKEFHVLCMEHGLMMRDKLAANGATIEHQFGPGAVETAFNMLRDMLRKAEKAEMN